MTNFNPNITLWNDEFLQDFAKNRLMKDINLHYWFNDPKSGDLKINKRLVITKFLPALGVFNIDFGLNNDGTNSSTLVFRRGNRCQEIDAETLYSVVKKINYELKALGDELNFLIGDSQVFAKGNLKSIKSLYELLPLSDTRHTAYRFFQNGWIEITKDSISDLKSYEAIPDGRFVWNSQIIPHDYKVVETKASLQAQRKKVMNEQVHPVTGEKLKGLPAISRACDEIDKKLKTLSGKEPATHYRDFITNLSRDRKREICEDTFNRLKLAIGYLCHGYNIRSNRKAVVAVERFHAGMDRNSAMGGTGKSILFNTLSSVVNYVELNGKEFTKQRQDPFTYSPVQFSTQLVHFADADSKYFHTERLFNQISDDFSVRKRGGMLFSIPRDNAPKVCVSSNNPLKGSGTSYDRRQFIVEIGGFYRDLMEQENLTPNQYHGNKHIASNDEWEVEDWVEYYRFIFECIQLYLTQPNGLPHTRGSADYDYRKLVEETNSEDMSDWLIEKVQELQSNGGEYFAEKFYAECRKANPQETKNKTGRCLFNYLVLAGNVEGLNFKLEKLRLTKTRLKEWVKAGLEFWEDRNGKCKKLDDKVQVLDFSKKVVQEVVPISTPEKETTSAPTNKVAPIPSGKGKTKVEVKSKT